MAIAFLCFTLKPFFNRHVSPPSPLHVMQCTAHPLRNITQFAPSCQKITLPLREGTWIVRGRSTSFCWFARNAPASCKTIHPMVLYIRESERVHSTPGLHESFPSQVLLPGSGGPAVRRSGPRWRRSSGRRSSAARRRIDGGREWVERMGESVFSSCAMGLTVYHPVWPRRNLKDEGLEYMSTA